jgi:hypothetical protein
MGPLSELAWRTADRPAWLRKVSDDDEHRTAALLKPDFALQWHRTAHATGNDPLRSARRSRE